MATQEHRGADADWLTQTKLHSPRLREEIIPRERLLTALRDALTSHALTLVSAPAGYGKTTLLAALVKDEGRRACPEPGEGMKDETIPPSSREAIPHAERSAFAWISLDEEDNDPARFLVALIAALRKLDPAFGATTQALLSNLPNPAAEARRVIGVLINDILETLPNPFVVVLDDLHLITEPTIYSALDYLLEFIPQQMRVAVGTRHDPPLSLAQLRARGQLAEIRAGDLRFTPDETAQFLNEQLRLQIARDDLDALQARTEGWVAGLRLLATSLNRLASTAERADFIVRFAQSDRYVFDFLAEQVLNDEEPAVRAFLLKTCILPELNAALCRAVTDRADAETMLEDLYRRNLFLVAVGEVPKVDEGRRMKGSLHPSSLVPHPSAFRYHHLFAEFLRGRLAREMPEQIVELHRRAAEAESAPTRAIAHYLAAEMWEQAAGAIEQAIGALFPQGLWDTLRGWILAVPPAVRDAHPALTWCLGNCTLFKGDYQTAQALFEKALRDVEATGETERESEALASLTISTYLQGDFERAGELIRRALARPVSRLSLTQLLMFRVYLAIFVVSANMSYT